MKLGTKVTCGFGSLTAIAVILGGIAVVCAWSVRNMSVELSTENVPAVSVANQIERHALKAMLAIRGYGLSEDTHYLETGRASLAETKKALENAAEHAKLHPNLVVLKANVEKAQAKVAEYEKLVADTVAKTEALQHDKSVMDASAKQYMDACHEYLKANTTLLAEQINGLAKSADASAIKATLERARKIEIANEIIDLGNAIRIDAHKAMVARDPKLFQDTLSRFPEVEAKLDSLKPLTHTDEQLKRIENCRAAARAYAAGMTGFLTNWLAREELGKQRNIAGDGATAAAEETAVANMEKTETMASSAASTLGAVSTTLIIGLAIAIVLSTILAVLITRSIVKPVMQIAAVLQAGAEQTSSASTQVASASQSLAQGASEQAAALEETTSSMEEMSSMTKKNATTAEEAARIAAQTNQAAREGDDAMQKMVIAINGIQESSAKTAGIIKVIDEIAFQTNLLALNAAVEAARAGDAGKGFAVVAAEVRSLAMRSAEAAKNTASMIEQSVDSAKSGVVICQEVAKLLQAITSHAGKVNGLVGEIAAASKEQSQGIEAVNKAVSDMDKVTQSSASNAEESASAAEELASQAEQLAAAVQQLMAMVHGDAIGSQAPRSAHPAQLQAPKRRQEKAKAAKAKLPKLAIPLDASEAPGSDFGDFGLARKAA